MGVEEHRKSAAEIRDIGCAIITISDRRTPETDETGNLIQNMLKNAGYNVKYYEILPNNLNVIQSNVSMLAQQKDIKVIITAGGTGSSKHDITIDAVSTLFDRTLPGFGEFFRAISFKEIGTAAMLSRSTAGIIKHCAVFCLPGSPSAVKLALEQLILPELKHLVWELSR